VRRINVDARDQAFSAFLVSHCAAKIVHQYEFAVRL
jgi:hypothetical protein